MPLKLKHWGNGTILIALDATSVIALLATRIPMFHLRGIPTVNPTLKNCPIALLGIWL
jgi:hypothetical protein